MSTIKVNTIQDTGTNNAMTISGGVVTFPNKPTFTSGGAAAVDIISSNNTGGSTTALEIDLSTSNDYAYQKLILSGFCCASGGHDLHMQLRKDSNDTYITDSYLSIIGSHMITSSSSSSSQNGLWNGAHFRIVHNGLGNDSTHQLNDMEIDFFNTANDKKFNCGWIRNGQNASGVMREQGSGKGGYADVVDRVKFILADTSVAIVWDSYTLYGYRRAL
jgi:hypothetical protein